MEDAYRLHHANITALIMIRLLVSVGYVIHSVSLNKYVSFVVTEIYIILSSITFYVSIKESLVVPVCCQSNSTYWWYAFIEHHTPFYARLSMF